MPPKRSVGRPKLRAKAAKAKKPKATAKARKPKRPTLKAHAKRPAIAKRSRTPAARAVPEHLVSLGEVVVPSGRLAIFDVGLVGYLPPPALAPTIVEARVPRDRAVRVVGRRVGRGRFADCWDHVAIVLDDDAGAEGERVVASKKLGDAAIDFGRVMLMDVGALDHWKHEDSLDGLADVVFWGRDDAKLARVLAAPRRPGEGYGWANLPLADAEAKSDLAAKYKAENKWLVQIDVRPHSHDFQIQTAAKQSPNGAGTLELAGARMLLVGTSWGDGVFPVYLDLDDHERPVQVRVQLAMPEVTS